MKAICTKLACFLLVLLVSGVAMAESITSPNGQLQLNFSVNALYTETYDFYCSFKNFKHILHLY